MFIKNGGRVLSSGKSGLSSDGKSFSMLEWDFISVRGQTDSRACYYRTAEPVCKEINTAWATYAPGILMDVKKSGTALAHLSENYFSDVWDKHYFDVTWGGTSDLYSSHLYYYIPPKEEVCGSAAAFDGRVCHISFEIFCAYYNYAAVFHKELVSYILKQMLKEPLIKAEALPSTSRASLCRGEKYDLLHVKATYPQSHRPYFHIIEEHNTLPAGTEISVKGKYKSVRLLPEEKENRQDLSGRLYNHIPAGNPRIRNVSVDKRLKRSEIMKVNSVLGVISRDELGVVSPHEHIFIDLSAFFSLRPLEGIAHPESEPVKMEHLGQLNRDPYALKDNLVMDHYETQLCEILRFRSAGGRTVVDATMHGHRA